MPIYTIQAPDGKTYDIEGPEGATAEQLGEFLSSQRWSQKKSAPQDKGILQNIGLGALKGASNIGATLLAPVDWTYDKVTGKKGTNDWRKQSLKDFYEENANTDSYAFKGGELASEIAGTAGAGGVLAKGVGAIPALAKAAPKLATALETGGFKIGGAPATSAKEMAKNVATRLAGGAVTGGVSAGMVNPDDAITGAGIGAAMPVVGKLAYDAGKATKAAIIDPIVNQDLLVRRAIANAVGEDAMPSVLARLGEQAKTHGVRFSAAQSTQNPALAAMEDAFLATNPGGALNAQSVANRQVLADRMRGIAGSESDMLAAKEARRSAAEPLYSAAESAVVTSDDALREIISRLPNGTMEQAQNIARMSGKPIRIGRDIPSQTIYKDAAGNLVDAELMKAPVGPKGRSLLDEIKKAGGINMNTLGELHKTPVEAVRGNPGLFRKDGLTEDGLLEFMIQKGWIDEATAVRADAEGTGGALEIAKDYIKSALDRNDVFHPSQAMDIYSHNQAMQAFNDFASGVSKTDIPAKNAQYTGRGIDMIKRAIDDFAGGTGPTSIGRNTKDAALGAQEALLNWADSNIPEYAAARAKYAEMSNPINRMQVGSVLRDKFIPATSGDIPASLNAASLAGELRKADYVAQKATGMKGLTFDRVMGDQAPVVRGISSDASRIAETTKLGMGVGSPTARRQSISNFIGDNLATRAPLTSAFIGALGNVPVLNYGTKMLGSAGNMLGEKLNARMAARLEDVLANNPKELEKALLEAQKNKIRGLLAEQYVSPTVRSAIIQGGLLSAQ